MNKPTKLILITGKAQSGKDTAADYLLTKLGEFGKTARKYSFADPLKSFLMEVFGCTYEQMYGSNACKDQFTKIRWETLPKLPDWYAGCNPIGPYMTARQLMQYFGTEVVRAMYDNAWAEATIRRINSDKVDVAILPDCRFPNEIMVAMDQDPLTMLVRLTRNTLDQKHASETSLDKYKFAKHPNHFVLDNTALECDVKNIAVWNFVKDHL